MTMSAEEIFARCAQRRRAVADLIESLNTEQLATPSLCAAWDVRTVAGHLIVPLAFTPGRVARTTMRCGGSFHRASEHLSRAAAREPVPRMAAMLRERADSRFTPPLHGPAAPLTDLCVHTGDMRVPLGLSLDIAPDEAEAAFDLLSGFTMFILPRRRLRGIHIAPDDLHRTWGDGATITGRAADILMAILGRRQFLSRRKAPPRFGRGTPSCPGRAE